MRTIYKYAVPIVDTAVVEMPEGACPLHVGAQDQRLILWAQVDTDSPIEARRFFVRGTDNLLLGNEGRYIGTAQVGIFVWHVYEDQRLDEE